MWLDTSLLSGWQFNLNVSNNLPADEMFLNDPFEHLWRAGVVPDPLRINDRDWSAGADLQAIRLRAEDAAVACELQFFQSPLEVVPRGEARLLVDAFWLRLIGAEEQVALNLVSADGDEFGPWAGSGFSHRNSKQ